MFSFIVKHVIFTFDKTNPKTFKKSRIKSIGRNVTGLGLMIEARQMLLKVHTSRGLGFVV